MIGSITLRKELKLVTFLPKDPESPFPPEQFASSHIILISTEGKIYLVRFHPANGRELKNTGQPSLSVK